VKTDDTRHLKLDTDDECNIAILERLKESDSSILARLYLSEKYWYESKSMRHEYMATKRDLEQFNPWGNLILLHNPQLDTHSLYFHVNCFRRHWLHRAMELIRPNF